MLKYFDANFASQRLRDTIINIGGRACVVRGVEGERQDIHYTDCVSGEVGVINIEDDKVAFVPPKIGYINIPRHGAKFFSRMPERRWKQGIPTNLFRMLPLDIVGMALNGESYKPFRRCLRTKMLTAFHRNWAVGDGTIHYKGERVATVDVNGAVEFNEGKLWLKECFEEVIR